MRDVHRQLEYGVRFDWGFNGAKAIGAAAGCTVVIDVFSFTTSVSIAVGRGTDVFPYRWSNSSAPEYAAARDAALAMGRSQVSNEHPYSLSPAVIATAPATSRLVLPSPNGSTISFESDGVVFAASLRNASAVAQHLIVEGYGTIDRPIAVIAAGEKWPDGGLRPAIEDLLGAGLVLTQLQRAGLSLSPEAKHAVTTCENVDDVAKTVRECASGLELIEDGYGDDIDIALDIDADTSVPKLTDGAFRSA